MSSSDITPTVYAVLSERDRSRFATLIVAAIVIISCIPIMLGFTAFHQVHDTVFHLYRIDGIAQGLRDGQLPVLMQTLQIKGYGYPVSICYGDLFLYIPAVFRLLGFSMHASYGLFIVLINTFCAASTYYVFKRIFGERRVAVLSCALWTLSPYRLIIDTYLRGAVGELLALSFFPIIFYGLYSIIWYQSRGASRFGWLWCAMGVAAIVYSHILSIMMAFLVFFPILVIGLIQNGDKKVLGNIILSAVVCLALSLAFIVPFLDFYSSVEMQVNMQSGIAKQSFAYDMAVQPAQLFELFPDVQQWSLPGTSLNEMPYGIGWNLLFAIPLWCTICFLPALRSSFSRNAYRFGLLILALVGVFTWMTTVYFPWKYDSVELIGKLLSVLATIQFPWRLIGPVSFLLTILLSLSVSFLSKSRANRVTTPLVIAVMALSCVEAGFGATSFLNHSLALGENYSESDLTFGVMNGEYLPANVELEALLNDESVDVVASPGVEVKDEPTNSGTSYRVNIESSADGGLITIPRLMYPQYRATANSGQEFAISSNRNGLIQVEIPGQFSGEVLIEFVVPKIWRLSEAFSFIVLLAMLAKILLYRFVSRSAD